VPEPSRQYDEEGGVDPDIQEVQEGLNVALGTNMEIGSWLPTTRQPSTRRVEHTAAMPQIVVQDTTVDDGFELDERDTAGLTVNASHIAGAAPVRGRQPSTRRPSAEPPEMLGHDLGAVERRGSGEGSSSRPNSSGSDGSRLSHPAALTPGASTVMRHIRKASQRIVNIANTDDQKAETPGGFPFPGLSPKIHPSTPDGPQEFPFPSLDAKPSPVEKLSSEYVIDFGEPPAFQKVKLHGKSLFIFGPDNVIRNWFCIMLLHSYVHSSILLTAGELSR
jgi:hypothetical protein